MGMSLISYMFQSKCLLTWLLFLFLTNLNGQVTIDGKEIFLHAHNDYEQVPPLFRVASLPIHSIEVDIFEHNDRLVVSHDDEELDKKPSLQELYLQPLSEHLSDWPHLQWLYIDIKEMTPTILMRLTNELSKYPSLFRQRNELRTSGQLTAIISGDVDRTALLKGDYPMFFVDGRKFDIYMEASSPLMPVISANFESFSKWEETGKLTANELSRLRSFLSKAKDQDKLVRFWNVPEGVAAWKFLLDLGVSFIGLDDFSPFLDEMNIE